MGKKDRCRNGGADARGQLFHRRSGYGVAQTVKGFMSASTKLSTNGHDRLFFKFLTDHPELFRRVVVTFHSVTKPISLSSTICESFQVLLGHFIRCNCGSRKKYEVTYE